jgi:hypothetical protein
MLHNDCLNHVHFVHAKATLQPPGVVDRIRQLEVCASTGEDRSDGLIAPSYQRLQQDALDVERRTIIQLRDEYVINDEVLRRIQSDLDHAEARLHAHD